MPTIPSKGLAFSSDGQTYYEIPVVPSSLELEVEQVTADSYRTVGRGAFLYTDFLPEAIKLKITMTLPTLNAAQFKWFMDYFYLNNFIWLKFANPQNPSTYLSKQFKCNNPKFNYQIIDKTTGLPTEIEGFTQSFTMR